MINELLGWMRASRCSNGACIEVAFRKSSHSADTADCVEVAITATVLVRDSKQDNSPVLAYGRQAWADFLAGIQADEFDQAAHEAPTHNGVPAEPCSARSDTHSPPDDGPCTCPDIDVSTWGDDPANPPTIKGYDNECPIHGGDR